MGAPPALAPRPVLDEADVIARSRGWWEARDRAEQVVVEPLGPSFVMFEDGRFFDRPTLEKMLEGRKAQNRPVRTRTWSRERIDRSPGTAVYVGFASEVLEGKPPIEGWNTLVWVHDGTRWTVAFAQWDRGGQAAERERWNEYFAQGIGFNKEPNKLLVESVKGKKPGKALDIAMGQGRNAVFLASQKWKTTGIDISDEGIRQAKAEAATRNVPLEGLLADIDVYDLGKARWDLITLIYAGTDPKLVERVKVALAKGGLFVVEYFHIDSEVAKSGAGGFKTGELAAAFKDGFEILRDDVVDDNADWAGQRTTKLVRFVARKK